MTPPDTRARLVEIPARTVTRRLGVVDPWFLGRYGFNLYRGCEHACAYCDGRAERYRVDGEFERDVAVKVGAVAVLAGELRRRPEPGFVLFGGGVSDAWQPAEARYRLARGVLEIALAEGLPVHALTKSALVERDLDLLEEIAKRSRAILSFSIQTLDEGLRERFEPGTAKVAARFRLLEQARLRGLATAVAAMPVLPGLSDQPEAIDRLLRRAADAGVDFVLCGGLTLRPGAQKEHMLRVVGEHSSGLVPGYLRVFREERSSGRPDREYLRRVDARFLEALARTGLPSRAPRRLFSGLMPAYAEVAVLLEHEEEAARVSGKRTPALASAGASIQAWARRALGRRARRRDFDHRELGAEFRRICADGTIREVAGVSGDALPVIRRLLEAIPLRETAGQIPMF